MRDVAVLAETLRLEKEITRRGVCKGMNNIGVLPCDKGVLLQCTPFFSSEV